MAGVRIIALEATTSLTNDLYMAVDGNNGTKKMKPGKITESLEANIKAGTEATADYHLGFYLDENGNLCQVEED